MSRARLFVISGPSGAGKGTIISEVMKRRDRLFFSVSATTRAPRPGEMDGREYLFVSTEEFRDRIASGGMLEWTEYQGMYYGTPTAPVEEHIRNGCDVLLDIEAEGMHNVKRLRPDAVTIFVYPPSFAVLEQRLRGRHTESEEKILGRLKKGRQESAHAGDYDYIVINDELEAAVQEVMTIMAAEKSESAADKKLADAYRTANRLHILKEDKTL